MQLGMATTAGRTSNALYYVLYTYRPNSSDADAADAVVVKHVYNVNPIALSLSLSLSRREGRREKYARRNAIRSVK